MKHALYLLFALLPFTVCAQRVVTLDPATDAIARRLPDGAIRLVVPEQVLAVSILEAFPQVATVEWIGLQKVGRSNYIMVRGADRVNPAYHNALAILLVETSPGIFQADDLVISCNSAGDCRECSLPPLCSCNKGEGSCNQNSVFMTPLKKVTVTLSD